jgi:putative transposase
VSETKTVIRTFRFKLKPTRAQHQYLRDALEHSRQLYNAALEERIDCYRKTGHGRTYFDQTSALTALRNDENFSRYAISMQRAPLKAVDFAYKAFFSRGGYPRFKGREWFKSIAWTDQYGWSFMGEAFRAKGIGTIRVHQHRKIPAEAKTARIKRQGRHWYILVGCPVEIPANDNAQSAIGLDLGLSSFAALSDGTLIPAPRHARASHAKQRRLQRALARCKRGSKRRRLARNRLSAHHARIARIRQTDHFQLAANLCRRFGMIAIEKLNIKGMAKSRLARSVNDAAWGRFIQILCDKAESAGVRVVKVDPRHTSQTCPECGTVEPKALSQRVHRCECGYEDDRDVAAAKVILMRAAHGPPEGNVGECAVRTPMKAAANGHRDCAKEGLIP